MRYIFTVLTLFLSFSFFSQKNLSNALKSRMYHNTLPARFNVLVEGDIQKLKAAEKTLGIKVKYYAKNIACVNMDVNAISPLIESKAATYIEFIEPRLKTMNDTMLVRNRIRPVKLGTSPLTSSYDGTGILMGIVDTGIDHTHPDFKDALGNTRISFIWDQTVSTPTNSPAPFGYGEEWTAAQINASACTHNDMAHWGHGTHVSGIAAGNGLGNGTHEGIASKSEIVVVALDFNASGPVISDAVQYIINKATAAGKPFVINASVGDYYGSHDGTNTEAQLLNSLMGGIPGRVMVCAAGNAGQVKFHTQNIVTPTDTNFTWVTNSGVGVYYWLHADTANIKNVKWSVGANSPNFTYHGNIGFKNHNYSFTLQQDTIWSGTNRIGVVESLASINSFGVYELFVLITQDSLNYLWSIESTGSGKYDAWNFGLVSTGLPTTTQYPRIAKYVMPDTFQTMCSSFQCSDEMITVANYINLKQYYDVNNTLQTTTETAGKLAITSSCGPTRDNRQKPEVAATGGAVFSCMELGMQSNLITNAPGAVAAGSLHVIGGGTSASSPVVAGLAALYLQAHPTFDNKQVRQAIINCTYSDAFTGTVPNYQYGYGKLDGFSTFTCAVVTGIDSKNNTNESTVYPNPFNQQTTIKFAEKINGEVKVFNSVGQLIFTDKVNSDEYTLTRKTLRAEGVYMITVKTPYNEYNYKVIAVD